MSVDAVIAELDDFYRQRCSEVKRYIDFVQKMADHKVSKMASETPQGIRIVEGYDIDRELVKTLRANSFLLLYNLVESTMTNAVDAIHQSIRQENIDFDSLNDSLKRISIKNARKALETKHGMNSFLAQQHPINFAVVSLGYNKRKLFSGNVDCESIFNTSKNYGFELPDPKRKWHSLHNDLERVRDQRNALAHGRVSFQECGQETPPDYIKKVSWETMAYLRIVLWVVKSYIRNQAYKA